MKLREFNFIMNKLPFYLILYPTSRCNARCPHCFNYERQISAEGSKELSLSEIEKISNNFNRIKVLTITGGEPFLRNDLAEITSVFYRNNAVQYVSIHTNGFLTGKIIDVVSGILRQCTDLQIIVCISIDEVGKEHDRFRGVKGGFDKALETIGRLNELKSVYKYNKRLNLVTSTIFCNSTSNSFTKTISFIQENIKGVRPSLGFIRGSVKNSEELKVDIEAYKEFYNKFKIRPSKNINPYSPMAFKEAIEMLTNKMVISNYIRRKQTVPCQAGRKLIVIYENGDVHPCEILEGKFGNLRDVNYDIRKLLCSETAEKRLKEIRQGKICWCTWENIIPVNLLFSPSYYPRIFYEWLRFFIFGNNQ